MKGIGLFMSEPVQVKRVALPEDTLARLITPERARALLKKGVYTYGILKEGQRSLMGVCIFSLSDDVPLAVSLEELYVLREYRGNGYGRILLEKVMAELKKDKIRYVLYKKVSEKIDEVFECYGYAIKNGFVPSVIDEKILYYDIVSLLGRNFENNESEIKKELDSVVRFKDLSGEEIIRFNEKKDHGFYKIRLKSFDEKLTHFFMDKGEILGVAKAVRDGTKVILNNIYLKPEINLTQNYEALLIEFVRAAAHDESIELVVIQTVGNERKEIVKKLLGRSNAEYPATELVRYLDTKEVSK